MSKYVNVGMNFSFATQLKGGANELNIISRLVKHGLKFNCCNSPNNLQQNNAQNSHHILMLS
ncbi:hypothetical protein QUA54_15110 [Microcoleus sp. MOSTC5]|uniref:hypothetical protein n=1 Tax=Microcoleus sp. MOSTC5 TaxID=3055378 RepID=UPI002FD2295F